MSASATAVLREFGPVDYDGYIALSNRCYPDYPWSVEEARHDDDIWDHAKHFKRRIVAEADGRVVGSGDLHHSRWTFRPDKYWIEVKVDPDHRRRGHGSALYDALERAARERGARALVTSAKESLTEGVRFAEKRGFVEVKRDWESRLDVGAFDFEPFAAAPKRVAEQRITVTTLAAELARDPDALRRAYELDMDCARDVPSVDPFTPPTFEEWTARVIDPPSALPEAWFLAVGPDGRYLGVSNMFKSLEDPSFLWQGLTGVRREARGMGLAIALKLETVRYAKAKGLGHIKTWNDVRNRPMLRINEALGFVKQPVWIEYQKELAPGA